ATGTEQKNVHDKTSEVLRNGVGRTNLSVAARGDTTALLLQGEIRLLSFRPGGRSRDDLLQHRHMADEGAAPRGGGNHCGLRFLADKCLFHRDVAGPCQRFDMSAEIAIGSASEPF